MLSKVIIKNFMSIKEEQTLKINKDLTAIIGKNESGKSSILKAINKLNEYIIDDEEKNVELKNEKSYIKGLFILENNEIKHINDIYEEENNLGFYSLPIEYGNLYYEIEIRDKEKTRYYSLYYLNKNNKYENINTNIFLIRIIRYIKQICKDYELSSELEEKILNVDSMQSEDEIKKYIDNELINLNFSDELIEEFKNVSKQIKPQEWIELLPKYEFILFSSFDSILKDNVLFNDLNKNKQAKNILKIANININELDEAYKTNNEQALEDLGTQCIDIVSKKFKQIFQQTDTDFKIKVRFGSAKKDISFLTQDKTSGNKTILLSKRSEGFRWYLSLYLTLYDYLNDNSEKKYILLLDEPNLYLHPGAQNNLLYNVFKKEFLNTQIIYTTHSPYMIDTDNSYSIRIVEKDKQTLIFNSSQEYSEKNKKNKCVDTLTPLLTALELDVTNSIMLNNDEILIIVEGIQDVYILNTMIELTNNLNITNKIKFIPGIGASKVPYLYSYLYGMGYNVYTLLDADKAGKDAISEILNSDHDDERKNKLLTYDINNNQKHDFILEDLFSENDKKKYLPSKSTILYKRIYDEKNDLKFEDETINNFKKFFKDLFSKLEDEN